MVLLYKRVVLVGAQRVPRAIELQTWVREILLNLLTSVIYYIYYIYIFTPYTLYSAHQRVWSYNTNKLPILYDIGWTIFIYRSFGIYDCITRVYILLYLSQKQYRIEGRSHLPRRIMFPRSRVRRIKKYKTCPFKIFKGTCSKYITRIP